MGLITAIILVGMFIGVAILLLGSHSNSKVTVTTATNCNDVRLKEAEARIKEAEAEKAKLLAAAEAAAEKKMAYRLEMAKGDSGRESVRRVTMIGDSYFSVELKNGATKEELQTSLDIAKLCKGGRLNLPSCGSLSWNDGPEIELAKQGLSKNPLYGGRLEININAESGAGAFSEGSKAQAKADTKLLQQKEEDRKPANGQPVVQTSPPPVKDDPALCKRCGKNPAKNKDGGGYHNLCDACHQAFIAEKAAKEGGTPASAPPARVVVKPRVATAKPAEPAEDDGFIP